MVWTRQQMESYAQQFSCSQSQAVKFSYMTFFSTHVGHINTWHCMIPNVTLCIPTSLVGRMIWKSHAGVSIHMVVHQELKLILAIVYGEVRQRIDLLNTSWIYYNIPSLTPCCGHLSDLFNQFIKAFTSTVSQYMLCFEVKVCTHTLHI